MILSAQHKTTPRRGFTLIELMAASGIMIVIIMLVLSLTTNVLNTWTQSSGRLAQNFEARVAMDILALDIEAMDLRSSGIACLEVEQGDDAGGEADSVTRMYFLSKILDKPGNDIAGDVCAVEYQLIFRNPYDITEIAGGIGANGQPNKPVYGLYRYTVDSETTFNSVLTLDDYDAANNNTALSTRMAGGFNTVTDDGTEISANQMHAAESKRYFLSANIADFQVTFYYRDTAGDIQPINTSFVYAGGELYENGAATPTNTFSSLVYVDIKMTVLGDEGARLQAAGLLDGMDWEAFKAVYGETFTRRVYLMSYTI